MPDLPPTHHYAAFYRWLGTPESEGGWGADAIVHMGKHGTLEWLPGKGIGLSGECFPDLLLKTHLNDFLTAYNFARRLKTLKALTPYEYLCKLWARDPDRLLSIQSIK